MTCISPSKGLLGLLKSISAKVHMELLFSLSATFLWTVRRNQALTQMFNMVGTNVIWERLRSSGSFILQVPVSTSFDESSALKINYSLFSCSTAFAFSFPVE